MMSKFLSTFVLCIGMVSLVAQPNQPTSFGKGSTLYGHGRGFSEKTLETTFFNPEWGPFFHGVASGDPLEDRVIIWTRVTPDSLNTAPITVDWRVATDTGLQNVVQSGTFTTNAERDYTVKVDVTGLTAGTTYYYGFSALGANSLTGKTKTTPTGDQADHLKFAIVSCSNYQAGYFNAYEDLANRTDLDAVIHLGDYIYEYANFVYGDSAVWENRTVEPNAELLTLEDYRARYSTYRLDSNLARVHQQHPFITVWDDHESANDAYEDGAENHDPDTEGDWEVRKAIAKQAYFEWMPIRENAEETIYRTISYGNLVDLIMLDTRLEGRDEQILSFTDTALFSEDRTILGADQKAFFLDQLSNSDARWKVIGQQVIFSEFNIGWAALLDPENINFDALEGLFQDIWDGYPAERTEIFNHIIDNEIENVVVLTGDFHTSFANEVVPTPVDLQVIEIGPLQIPFYSPSSSYDPTTGDGAVAVEFVTPSITSANFDENLSLAEALGIQIFLNTPIQLDTLSLGTANPHMKYAELISHGHYILDIKADSVQANFFYTDILDPDAPANFGTGFYTYANESFLRSTDVPSNPKAEQDTPAPANPPQVTTSVAEASSLAVLSAYPNPASTTNTLHYALNERTQLRISLHTADGRLVKQLLETTVPAGIYTLDTSVQDLPNGLYFYRIEANGQAQQQRIVISR